MRHAVARSPGVFVVAASPDCFGIGACPAKAASDRDLVALRVCSDLPAIDALNTGPGAQMCLRLRLSL